MTEERLCCVCPVRGRRPDHYERAMVCEQCRVWLAGVLRDIVSMWSRLADDGMETDSPWTVIQLRADGRGGTRVVREPGYDPVAGKVPTGAPGRTPPRLGLVSGSREPAAPANLDRLDLGLPAHGDNLTAAGKTWWTDQIGHVSVAMELDLIARAWAEELDHHRPAPVVSVLAAWLTDRIDWACDRYAGVDSDATVLNQLRSTLRTSLGETEPRPERLDVPCPGCDLLTLIRRPGEDKVECADPDCRRVLTDAEYHRWTRLLAADIRSGNVVPADHNA